MSRLGAVIEFLGRLFFGAAGYADNPVYEGGEGVKSLWLSWQQMTYSGETTGRNVPPDVDLSETNRRMAVIFRDYFERDELDDAAVGELKQCKATLIRVVPSLTGNDRQYFAMALSIAQWLLEIQAGSEGHATT